MAITTTIRSPADVLNAALVQIGWKSQVGDLLDGSAAAQAGLAIYGQVRDDMLRSGSWGFAQTTIALTLLKQAPTTGYVPGVFPWNPATNPPPPWVFEYQYPDDCIKVRSVKVTPLFVINMDPRPNEYAILDDTAYSPSKKVLCCNVPDALCVYTRQETNPILWDSNFTQALIDQLGERLALALPQSADAAKLSAQAGQADENRAMMEQG